jgi:hypothetical protein
VGNQKRRRVCTREKTKGWLVLKKKGWLVFASEMSADRVDPMESWGRVRVDALELQDPYHRTDPEPLTEARQIAKMRALMTNNRKIATSGQSDGNSVFQQFKEVERILSEAEMCDKAEEFLLAKEL